MARRLTEEEKKARAEKAAKTRAENQAKKDADQQPKPASDASSESAGKQDVPDTKPTEKPKANTGGTAFVSRYPNLRLLIGHGLSTDKRKQRAVVFQAGAFRTDDAKVAQAMRESPRFGVDFDEVKTS